jgi:hypothetical protein
MTKFRMRWVRHVAHTRKRNAYRGLMGIPEGKRPLGRSRLRCGDNIKMNLRKIGRVCIDWIHGAQNGDQ